MQVTHTDDHVTHAVIGGKQTIDFGISNSAEFFNILSSTLYKNQKLAVIREVLCNAWDAHIVANRTNVPVEVTVANNQIIIKDFGLGIPDEDMGPIYGVYGASTKQNDGKQTGGFGLGCKAPFAYTDHFQVISCHKGTKTIYAISKSSASVNGKPGITPIVSIPTDDTGLTVTIQLRDPGDAGVFISYLKKTVLHGDIFCTLNDEVLPRIGMPMIPGSFIFTSNLEMTSRVYIRYGNVVYPIERNHEYLPLYEKAAKFAEVISDNSRGMFAVLFQAAPHSISVTPSRESLSMQEHTVKAITELLKNFVAQYSEKNFEAAKFARVDEYYKNIDPEEIDVHDFLSPSLGVRFTSVKTKNAKSITSIGEYVEAYLNKHYPRDFEFRLHDLQQRLACLVLHKKINEGLAKGFIQNFIKTDPKQFSLCYADNSNYHKREGDVHTVSEWFFKSFAKKLIVKFSSQFNLDRLYISDKHSGGTFDYNWEMKKKFGETCLINIRSVRFYHMNDMLPYLRNIVVLGSSKNILKSRAPSREVFTGSGFIFHHVGLKKTDIDEARAFWATTGMTVIDLCDERVTEYHYSQKPKKPKLSGYPTVRSAAMDTGGLCLRYYHSETIERIEKPEFYVRVSLRQDDLYRVPGFNRKTEWYMPRFGHLGALVHTAKAEETLVKKGIPKFGDYVAKWFINQILRNERILESQKFDGNKIAHLHSDTKEVEDKTSRTVLAVLGNPGLRKHFNMMRTMTEEDRDLLMMLRDAADDMPMSGFSRELLRGTLKVLKDIPLDPACEVFVKAIQNSPVISFLDTDEFDERYKETEDPIVHEQLVQLFVTILNL